MGLTQKLGTIPLAIQTDSSNNVGIGATPSGSFKLEVTGASKLSGFLGVNGSPATSFPFEAYINSSTAYSSTSRGNVMRVYNSNTGANVFAGIELGGAGTANDGLAGLNAVVTGSGSAALTFYTRDGGTFAERFRVAATGNVGIGTSNPSVKLDILGNVTSSTDNTIIRLFNNTGENCGNIDFDNVFGNLARITGTKMGGGSSADDGLITFSTAQNSVLGERMRITSGGYTKMSNTGTYVSSTGNYHELRSSQTDEWTTFIQNTAASPYGVTIRYSSASPNGGGNEILYTADSTGQRATIRSNGGIANYQSNNVNLSDIRTKKDIIPLESYWDKFKAIEIVKFKYKDQSHDDFNIGVIAQQVEQIAPEFVDIDGWDSKLDEKNEEPLKSIYTEDLHHATIKVLQEAMAKIEELEAKVTALENK